MRRSGPHRRAVEKLVSEIRNHLTPIIAYAELLSRNATEADRKKLNQISVCAHGILNSIDEFLAFCKQPRR